MNDCLSGDTTVLMWDGAIRAARHIVLGDELIGDNLSKRTIKETCHGIGAEMFNISSQESEYTVTKNHKLVLKANRSFCENYNQDDKKIF